jgi:hypothetical protein
MEPKIAAKNGEHLLPVFSSYLFVHFVFFVFFVART